ALGGRAEDLVGGHLEKDLGLHLLGILQDVEDELHIILNERYGVLQGPVNMGLGGDVPDVVRVPVPAPKPVLSKRLGKIAPDDLDPLSVVPSRLQNTVQTFLGTVVERGGRADNPPSGLLQNFQQDVGSHETVGTRQPQNLTCHLGPPSSPRE